MSSEVKLKNFESYKKKHNSCINNHNSNNFPVSKIFLVCYSKIPVFSQSGKSKSQIYCFPCAVATLSILKTTIQSTRSFCQKETAIQCLCPKFHF